MNFKIATLIVSTLILTACGSLNTFHEYARAGDTVALPAGMQPDFNKDNVTVTITPSVGADIILAPTDPAIRGVINLYPDPVSNMIISREISEDLTTFAQTYAASLAISSNFDKDWFQTTLFIDLPSTLPDGLTQIAVNNGVGASHTVTLEVIPGTGTENSFNSDFNGGLTLTDDMLDSMSRASHATVTLDSATIPHAIELTFSHDPDKTLAGGSGQAFVVNPLGYRKNVTWSDDGINMKVIILQSKDGIIDDMQDYKFYIAGSATNLQLLTVQGYDINGNVINGVTGLLAQN